MFSGMFGKKHVEEKSDYVLEDEDEKSDSSNPLGTGNNLKLNLSRMIHYAESADVKLQKEVAEKLANEAVKPERQVQIVEYGGLKLLVPLAKSDDPDVQRLAAHALANLSVNADNQIRMAKEGAIEILLNLIDTSFSHEGTVRQCCKALANLAVNAENKRNIADKGGIAPLIRIVAVTAVHVKVEAIAALANLAVLDTNEREIYAKNGIRPVIDALVYAAKILAEPMSNNIGMTNKEYNNIEDLASQSARFIRNMSSEASHRNDMIEMGAIHVLQALASNTSIRVCDQAKRAIKCLETVVTTARRPSIKDASSTTTSNEAKNNNNNSNTSSPSSQHHK